jgi:hypothetical protein
MMVNSGFPLTLSVVALQWMSFEHEVGTDSIFGGRYVIFLGALPFALLPSGCSNSFSPSAVEPRADEIQYVTPKQTGDLSCPMQ